MTRIADWLISNKQSSNVGKTKFIIFHKPNEIDGIPLMLNKLQIKNQPSEREDSIRFLGVLLIPAICTSTVTWIMLILHGVVQTGQIWENYLITKNMLFQIINKKTHFDHTKF